MYLAGCEDEKNEEIELELDGESPVNTRDIVDTEEAVDHGEIRQVLAECDGVVGGSSEYDDNCGESDGNPISRVETDHARDGKGNGILIICSKENDESA